MEAGAHTSQKLVEAPETDESCELDPVAANKVNAVGDDLANSPTAFTSVHDKHDLDSGTLWIGGDLKKRLDPRVVALDRERCVVELVGDLAPDLSEVGLLYELAEEESILSPFLLTPSIPAIAECIASHPVYVEEIVHDIAQLIVSTGRSLGTLRSLYRKDRSNTKVCRFNHLSWSTPIALPTLGERGLRPCSPDEHHDPNDSSQAPSPLHIEDGILRNRRNNHSRRCS